MTGPKTDPLALCDTLDHVAELMARRNDPYYGAIVDAAAALREQVARTERAEQERDDYSAYAVALERAKQAARELRAALQGYRRSFAHHGCVADGPRCSYCAPLLPDEPGRCALCLAADTALAATSWVEETPR